MKASELIGHLQSYISFVGKDCEMLVVFTKRKKGGARMKIRQAKKI